MGRIGSVLIMEYVLDGMVFTEDSIVALRMMKNANAAALLPRCR